MAEELQPDVYFILAGQSNMAGRGAASSAPPEVAEVLGLVGFGDEARWEVAREPLHLDTDAAQLRSASGSIAKAVAGVGPGVEFGSRISEAISSSNEWRLGRGKASGRKARVGLVPTAVGATNIDVWVPGGVLFANMMVQASAAQRRSPSSVLGGVLYYQGESDALDEGRAAAFSGKLQSFLAAVHSGLGEKVVVVVCAIHGGLDRLPFREQVRAALLASGPNWSREARAWSGGGRERDTSTTTTTSKRDTTTTTTTAAAAAISERGTNISASERATTTTTEPGASGSGSGRSEAGSGGGGAGGDVLVGGSVSVVDAANLQLKSFAHLASRHPAAAGAVLDCDGNTLCKDPKKVLVGMRAEVKI